MKTYIIHMLITIALFFRFWYYSLHFLPIFLLLLTWNAFLSSLRHTMVGCGLPEAWHTKVASSPSLFFDSLSYTCNSIALLVLIVCCQLLTFPFYRLLAHLTKLIFSRYFLFFEITRNLLSISFFGSKKNTKNRTFIKNLSSLYLCKMLDREKWILWFFGNIDAINFLQF